VDKDYDNYFGSSVSKDKMCDAERTKIIKICERNMLKLLNGKYRVDIEVEYTFVIQ
jgi:hypothetical protein